MKVAFAGAFAAQLAEPVRARLAVPYEVVVDDEAAIVARLADVDVLVSMGFSAVIAEAAPRLRLLQVPGAGLDRIDRGALGPGTHLANAYGHEAGIAEYIIGTMIALTRSFGRLDARMRRGEWESQWALGTAAPPLWPELAGKTLGILGLVTSGRRSPAAPPRSTWRSVPSGGRLRRKHRLACRSSAGLSAWMGAAAGRLSCRHAVAVPGDAQPDRRGPPAADEAQRFPGQRGARRDLRRGCTLRGAGVRKLAGAALDVWYRYPTSTGPTPPATQPFGELANVIMTPHISGWTEGMLEARSKLIAENIARTARGEMPLNVIKPAS